MLVYGVFSCPFKYLIALFENENLAEEFKKQAEEEHRPCQLVIEKIEVHNKLF